MVDMVSVYGRLKAVQDWIKAYLFLNRPVAFSFKATQKIFFIKIMKGVYNLISESNKPVDRIDWIAEAFVDAIDT